MFGRTKKLIKKISGTVDDKKSLSTLSSEDQELIARIRDRNLTYLSVPKLVNIVSTCRSIEASKLPGTFLEAGCALGGSSILIASLKSEKRPLFIYDIFGMIPPPTEDDTQDVHDRYRTIVEGKSRGIGGDKYYSGSHSDKGQVNYSSLLISMAS